ncbi:DEAD/DEAH box helicase [Carpediemonas membranifera]|uniref:DEAD/DEAH box helicase n=1 Tax=Carpediemonas membranifera TaxID=201153 RepID=A0A8J6BA36_9EUKA|nr:DEAD/DEAH box helicase [Carpediemonas membranifera]|eukprot:KAG9396419.1 DEAD/DEAH box helicase [Carpediemonas membranifera]
MSNLPHDDSGDEDTGVGIIPVVDIYASRQRMPSFTMADRSIESVHWSKKQRSEMTDSDWAHLMQEHRIKMAVPGRAAPRPCRNWAEMNIPDVIRRSFPSSWTRPTPVQMASIKAAISGWNLDCVASTGSGKTAAYAIPTLTRLLDNDLLGKGASVLILVPTRELAEQVLEMYHILTAHVAKCSVYAVYSGADTEAGRQVGVRRADVIVGTPDLIHRHIADGNLNLHGLHALIIDEADRIVEQFGQGPLGAIISALGAARPSAQRLQYSATRSEATTKLAHTTSRVLSIECATPPATITHRAVLVPSPRDRLRTLAGAVDEYVYRGHKQALVFVNTRSDVQPLVRALQGQVQRVRVLGVHGEDVEMRRVAAEALQDSRPVVVVCTDLFGRGIDAPHLGVVINYDLPQNRGSFDPASFTHRVGRVGRAGKAGVAVTIAHREERTMFRDLRAALRAVRCRDIPDEIR